VEQLGDTNLFFPAPTGSGKTVIMECAILRLLQEQIGDSERALGSRKVVYMAPVKALCQQIFALWSERFAPLGVRCSWKFLVGHTNNS
jgi:ATP-dependent DNA helicase HFM1/MER3